MKRVFSKLRQSLALVLAALSLLVSPPASALSLGGLDAQSAVGEPLRATVDVHTDRSGPVRVDVRRSGPVPAGEDNPVRAKYLPAARQLRIYTDAPMMDQDLAIEIQVHQLGVAFRATYSIHLPLKNAEQRASRPDNVYAGQQVSDRAHSGLTVNKGRIGPTGPDDTLRSIASAVAAQTGASLSKAEVAIYARNVGRFFQGDPRRLRPGSIISVPDIVDIELIPASEVVHFHDFLAGRVVTPLAPAQPAIFNVPAPPAWRLWINHLIATVANDPRSKRASTYQILFGALLLLTALIAALRTLRARLRYTVKRLQLMRERAAAPSGYERELGAARPVPPRDAIAISKLQDMLAHDPNRHDLRLRLAERLCRVRADREFLMHARILRDAIKPDQFRRVRRMAQDVGIKDSMLER